jgi:glutathione synthase/RimK-type ligase-like ATP-grasp enzyme
MSDRGVLLVGSSRDPTFVHSVRAVVTQNRRGVVLDIDRFCAAGTVEGELGTPESLIVRDGSFSIRLGDYRSCYARFVELLASSDPTPSAASTRFRLLQLAIDSMSTLVVNRPSAGGSNNSKPHQVELLRGHGFRVPRGLSTNNAEAARAFLANCSDGAVYKSNSGIRSIVRAVEDTDVERFEALEFCPAYFQERVWGDNVRVHVIADQCHSVLIRSSCVDYRYDRSGNASEERCVIPDDIARKCVDVTASLGLTFSGIDFVRSRIDGEMYCLEVNPMPGYHGYDLTLDYEISATLIELLDTTQGTSS